MDNQTQVQGQSQSEAMLSVENLIKNHVKIIYDTNAEIKKIREMHTDSFINNPLFHERDEQAKQAIKARSVVRAEIAKSPDVAKLAQQLKDLRFDMKESKNTLSQLLLDYHDQTKATQLELFDGVVGDIVLVAKLVRARAKN